MKICLLKEEKIDVWLRKERKKILAGKKKSCAKKKTSDNWLFLSVLNKSNDIY